MDRLQEQFFECNFLTVVKTDRTAVHKPLFFQNMPHDQVLAVCVHFKTVHIFWASHFFGGLEDRGGKAPSPEGGGKGKAMQDYIGLGTEPGAA